MSSFPVIVTDEAFSKLQSWLARKAEPGTFIRFGVKGGGCSGLEYVLKLDPHKLDNDLVLSKDGVEVLCDPKSAVVLQGSTLVWTGNLAGGFRFDNPNADRSCGCGTSFTLKKT